MGIFFFFSVLDVWGRNFQCWNHSWHESKADVKSFVSWGETVVSKTSSFTYYIPSTEFVSWLAVWVVHCRLALGTFPGFLKGFTFLRHRCYNRIYIFLTPWVLTQNMTENLSSCRSPAFCYLSLHLSHMATGLDDATISFQFICAITHCTVELQHNTLLVWKHTQTSGHLEVTLGQNWLDRKFLINIWLCRRDENINFSYFMNLLCIHTHTFVVIIVLDTSLEKSRSWFRSVCKMWTVNIESSLSTCLPTVGSTCSPARLLFPAFECQQSPVR